MSPPSSKMPIFRYAKFRSIDAWAGAHRTLSGMLNSKMRSGRTTPTGRSHGPITTVSASDRPTISSELHSRNVNASSYVRRSGGPGSRIR